MDLRKRQAEKKAPDSARFLHLKIQSGLPLHNVHVAAQFGSVAAQQYLGCDVLITGLLLKDWAKTLGVETTRLLFCVADYFIEIAHQFMGQENQKLYAQIVSAIKTAYSKRKPVTHVNHRMHINTALAHLSEDIVFESFSMARALLDFLISLRDYINHYANYFEDISEELAYSALIYALNVWRAQPPKEQAFLKDISPRFCSLLLTEAQ